MTSRNRSQDTQIAWIGSGFFALLLSVGWYLSEYNKGYGEWCWGSFCFWILLAVGMSPLSEDQDSQIDLKYKEKLSKGICKNCGAKMYQYGSVTKKYSCHTCCSKCGGMFYGLYPDYSIDTGVTCTCPVYATTCSLCGESNCLGCDI